MKQKNKMYVFKKINFLLSIHFDGQPEALVLLLPEDKLVLAVLYQPLCFIPISIADVVVKFLVNKNG